MKLVLDEWVVREVIDTLYMARTTFLGITGLDSPQEVAKKSSENETAITRRISKAIDIIQQAEQPSLPEGLEEAANDYCSAYYDWDDEGERKEVVRTFKAGAEWLAGQFEKNRLDALRKVKALRDAQNMHAKTLNYGYRCLAIRLGKEVDEMLDKLKIK